MGPYMILHGHIIYGPYTVGYVFMFGANKDGWSGGDASQESKKFGGRYVLQGVGA